MKNNLKATFIKDQTIHYTGEQLSPHFAYKQFDIIGDSIVAFIGSCDINPIFMADLEDLKNKKTIFSNKMVHFIAEFFDSRLNETVLLQRLLIITIKDVLEELIPDKKFSRSGDDLFDDNYKITISIASVSIVSGLIHTGVNIVSNGTPVPTKGLSDYKIKPEIFIQKVLEKYKKEIEDIAHDSFKVKGIL